MRSDQYTLAKYGSGYAGRGLKDFGPRVERILNVGRSQERDWRARHLRLDRVILQLRRAGSSMNEAMPPGQLGLFSGDAAA